MSTILRIYTHDRVWLYRIEPLLDVNVPVDKNAIVSTKLIAIDCNRISTVDCYLFLRLRFVRLRVDLAVTGSTLVSVSVMAVLSVIRGFSFSDLQLL